ncbi:MAG: hypothetical protein FWE87_01895 [Coriobacteriia bacterium]|nr:hypothetical protein [Coriobacteriia bacterium]
MRWAQLTDKFRTQLSDTHGQAVAEFAVALMLFALVFTGVGLYVRQAQSSASAGVHRETFARAPYTISSSVGSSGQCVKDILFH